MVILYRVEIKLDVENKADAEQIKNMFGIIFNRFAQIKKEKIEIREIITEP